MPRKKVLQPQLEREGILTNSLGIEIARLTLNDLLVINLSEMYFEVVRWAATHDGRCSLNHLCTVFSRYGTWGYDPEVYAAAYELDALQVIEFTEDKQYVRPIVTPALAVRVIPTYTTRAEAHAGLEELDE